MAPLLWKLNTVVFDCGFFWALCMSTIFAALYVGSLYLKTSTRLGRDHPDVIKARFVRVLCVCVLCVPLFWLSSSTSHNAKAQDVFTWLGLRFNGLLYASVIPLLLTMVLFIGPLTLHYLDGIFLLYADWNYWKNNLQNLIWIRNHIVGPFSEEFVFRACMLPILVPSLGENWSLILSPLFFGFAHVHHLMEKQRQGMDFKRAVLSTVFQMSYTTVFGLYSAFLFLRTGHLVAPFLAHMFCNHMGFPNFSEIFALQRPTRYYVMAAFVFGVLAWTVLLLPMTDPSIYSNDLYYHM